MKRRVDDHKFWAGGKSAHSVFPDGAKCKEVSSAEGAGELVNYQDDNKEIVAAQKKGVSQANSHKMKEGYRY